MSNVNWARLWAMCFEGKPENWKSYEGDWLWEGESESSQSCPTLCDPMNYRVHGILQARILEWVAFPFSRGSSQPRDWTHVSRIAGRFFLPAETEGKPRYEEINLEKGRKEKGLVLGTMSVKALMMR